MPAASPKSPTAPPSPAGVFLAALAAVFAGFLVALAPGSISESLRGIRPITLGWRTAQFFFNYQDLGFIKRGLVGTLLHPFPFLLTRAGLLGVSAAFILAVAAAFALFFAACARGAPARTRAILGAIAVLAPSFFLRLGFDYGRFDGLNLALTLAALGLIEAGWLVGAALICSACVLVHEGFIMLHFPLLLAYALMGGRVSRRPANIRRLSLHHRRVALRFAALPLLATALVFAFGSYRPGLGPLTGYFARNRAYLLLDEGVNTDAIATSTRPFFATFRYSLGMFGLKRAWLHLPVIIAWFSAFYACYARFHRKNSLPRDGLFYAALTPLLLGLIALDYYRWFALATVNMILVMLLRMRSLAAAGRPAEIDFDLSAKFLMASCLLGPISNTKSFPFAFMVLDRILPWHIPW